MKRLISLTAAIVLVIGITATGFAQDKTGKIGLSASGGVLFPLHGGYTTAGLDLSDVVTTGPNFRFGLSYWFNPVFALEGAFNINYMYYEDTYAGDLGSDPTWVMPNFTLNGIMNLGPLINPQSRVSPYVTLGMGIYPWWINDDGVTGDKVRSSYNQNEDFSATNFGLNAGAGIEFALGRNISLFGQGKYQYLFAEDTGTFGPYFEDQGLFSFDIGLTYYLPTR
jgi:opacity protein-like surface antigen